jgi:hypothetical protein
MVREKKSVRDGENKEVGGVPKDGRANEVTRKGSECGKERARGDGNAKIVVGDVECGGGRVKKGVSLPHDVSKKEQVTTTNTERFTVKYRSQEEDIKWASEGVVATILNGESIPLIQQRILMHVLKT